MASYQVPGFELVTNNNQPYNNVNLAVNEVEINDNTSVTVYGLYDDDRNQGSAVDGELPRPSENLKFITNEYGFLELLEYDENDSDDSSETSSSSSSSTTSSDEESEEPPENLSSCVTCGCFGLASEFYDETHCTRDCNLMCKVNEIQKQPDEVHTKIAVKRERDEPLDVEPEVKIKKLKTLSNPFKIHDVLEAIDPQHQSLFCPVVVVEVLGHRLLLKFICYGDRYSFWTNADSLNIFPVGFTASYNASHPDNQVHFHNPPNFSWESYLQSNEQCRVAPNPCFPHVHSIQKSDDRVRVGMKVEAVDRRNKNLICVATITAVLGGRFLVHFDSWDSLYDYWTFLGSGDVHYVGYCKEHGIDITPPHCYETASEFDWDEYLKKTNSVPLPRETLGDLVPIHYTVGQQVEVIDKRSPRLLRLASITKIHKPTSTLSLTFPSLRSPNFDYEVHAHDPDLHELGWGAATGHPVVDEDDEETENSPDRNSFPVCPNHKVCKSVCNIRGPNFPVHSKTRDCPYATQNLHEHEHGKFTDRVVVFEDSHYDLGVVAGQSSKNADVEKPNLEVIVKPEVKVEILKPENTVKLCTKPVAPINFNEFESTFELPKKSEIITWDSERIGVLVENVCSNLPTGKVVADQFRNNLIDGESFLMLRQNDLTDCLKIKLGPAVKIFNIIRLIIANK